MKWNYRTGPSYIQSGHQWTHKAETVAEGWFEFIATEHRGTDYVVPVPVQVVRALLATWDAKYRPKTKVLWRPVGEEELSLIEQSGWIMFPPRLPEQPIFYPVCSSDYAREIAEGWNARGGHRGFVTEFEVDVRYLEQHEVHQAGGKSREEYWIPAEELPSFNEAIVGLIRVVRTFDSKSRG